MQDKLKYSFFALLCSIFQTKMLRRKKMLAGVIILSSLSAIASCGSKNNTKTTADDNDSIKNDSFEVRTCYIGVTDPAYDSNNVQNTIEEPVEENKPH